MDFGNWPEIQQQPQYQLHQTNPTPSSTDPYSQSYNAPPPLYQPNYSYYPPHPSNPNSNQLNDLHTNPICPNPPPTQFDSTNLWPPATDPYATNHYLSHTGYDAASQTMPAVAGVGNSQFPCPNAQLGWGVNDANRQVGVDPVSMGASGRPPNPMEPTVGANPIPLFGLHHVANSAMYRRPKKTKVVQSAWCEVCKIDCNSKDVLEMHKLGKRHKRNVQKLEEPKKEASATTSAVNPSNKVAGLEGTSSSKEKTAPGQVVKREAPPVQMGDDLETKKRKLMQGGAPADSVRVCAVCNVACNSESVFKYHMAGQKHATQVRKQAAMGIRFITAM